MPNLAIDDTSPGRFPGDFKIDFTVVSAETADEKIYRDRVRSMLTELAGQHAEDAAAGEQPTDERPSCAKDVLAARAVLRAEAARSLLACGKAVMAGKLGIEKALEEAELVRATWKFGLKRLSQKLFFVSLTLGDQKPDSQEHYAVDLEMKVRDGLPPPHHEPGDAKQALFVDLYAVLTVIKAVCGEMERKRGRPFLRLFSKKGRLSEAQRPARTLDDYVRRIQGISVLGLSDSQTLLAKFALISFKQEVLSQQARRIKNGYVASLGLCVLVITALLLVPYALISLGNVPVGPASAGPFGVGWWRDHQSFLLAGIGAAVGTWLSFSIRNVNLTFEQLGSVETDMLNPLLRLLFVLALTLAAYLLFWTGAVGISIGHLTVDVENLKRAGSIAFLVGLFCGLSERALATAISSRSEAFVAAFNGGTGTPAPAAGKG